MESRGFRLSRSKTEYLRCEFSGMGGDDGEVIMDGVVVPRVERFKYLGSMVEERGDIDDDISHRIKVGGKNGERQLGYFVTRGYLLD